MTTALQNIKQMMDVNTVIGDPITAPDGTLIIPVSKVSLGFASAGSDFPAKTEKEMFGGGSGAGGTIVPVAFIDDSAGEVKLLQISPITTPADKAISLVPELFDKIAALFKKDKKKAADSAAATSEPII